VDPGVRIRLEGRLETVERTCQLLELALPDVRSGLWAYVGHVLDEADDAQVAVATGTVRTMAKTETALSRTVRRVDRARGCFERAVAAEAARRGVPPGSVRQQIDRLIADRVLFEAQLKSPFNSLLLPLAGVLGLATVVAWHHPVGWIAPALLAVFLGAVALAHSGSRFVLVTRDRLVVDGEVTPIAEIRVVETDGEAGDRPWPYVLHIGTRALPRIIRLPWIPQELVDAFAACGVEIRRYEWPFDGMRLNRRSRFKS
jgi:hypothetical protein